jgi:hypothetical protein
VDRRTWRISSGRRSRSAATSGLVSTDTGGAPVRGRHGLAVRHRGGGRIRCRARCRRSRARHRGDEKPNLKGNLYDLTSTYFEGQCPFNPQAQRGYSRDHRPDCKQVVLGLVLDHDGFPKAHEVFEGNRPDQTTVDDMLTRLEHRTGRQDRSAGCPRPRRANLLGAYRPAHRLSDAQRQVRARLGVRDALVRTRTRSISERSSPGSGKVATRATKASALPEGTR